MMKAVFMTPSLFYLLFGFFACLATAHRDIEDIKNREIHHDVIQKRIVRLRRADNSSTENWALGRFPGDFSNSIGQETLLGSEYTGCAVNNTSPTEADVDGALKLVEAKEDQSCVSGDSSSPRCVNLANDRSAAIYFCGYPGVAITCNDVADIVMALIDECIKVVDGESRVRGTVALFPGGDVMDSSKLSFVTVVSSDDDQFSGYL